MNFSEQDDAEALAYLQAGQNKDGRESCSNASTSITSIIRTSTYIGLQTKLVNFLAKEN